ncbi:MAG: hypothetical protein JNL79_02475 [Myxococcales bacterium]|nr:hypothetical protein [Myxococcales bacterium]
MHRPFLVLAAASLVACSSSDGVKIADDTGLEGGADTGATDSVSDVAGPSLFFHVRTSKDGFTHVDGLAGQTARAAKQGIRSFRLLRSATDPTPVTVFDHGKGFVEAGYVAGDDTVVGSAKIATLPAGDFKLAQVVVTHSRFVVSSTLHYLGADVPGDYDCVQTLSDGVDLDGVTRARGWYRYTFLAGGKSYPQEGTAAPLPTSPATGGFVLRTEGATSFYEMNLDVHVDPTAKTDLKVVVEVNMSESFRWEDQPLPGYAKGVYDTTPTSFEPIRRFGANTYVVRVE